MKSLKPKVKFITLGCRVNQYETQSMREVLSREGFDPGTRTALPSEALNGAGNELAEKKSSSDVDFVVINTCTVTGKADRESRYWIRRAKRDHPRARIVVTGCGVEREHQSLKKMSEVDELVFNHEKSDIAKHLAATGGRFTREADTEQKRRRRSRQFPPLSITCSEGMTRAFVKIQDGCNHACSFCKVVLVRGGSRSRPLEEVALEVQRLRDSGYKDIVFTGIQLGAYGTDLSEKRESGLPQLLSKCSKIEGIERLRLSSVEPTDVTRELIVSLRDIPKCMPHLHIPLQSGDDEILRRMNRRYDSCFYEELIDRLRHEIPDFNLTLDVMAGFPGEGRDHFENTLRLLERVRPLKCHIFPYSRREGTKASRFSDSVSPVVIRERVCRLVALEKRSAGQVMAGYVGRELAILVERDKKRDVASREVFRGLPPKAPQTKHEKLLYGHTPNFMKVGFRGEEAWVGSIVRVKLTGVGDGMMTGVPLS